MTIAVDLGRKATKQTNKYLCNIVVISVAEDDIGDPDDLDHTEHNSHTTDHFPGHTAKDLGK